jgi:hypothetical protein
MSGGEKIEMKVICERGSICDRESCPHKTEHESSSTCKLTCNNESMRGARCISIQLKKLDVVIHRIKEDIINKVIGR